ncbi:winged helix DNA-binding domain-containing protein [Antrihabitans sp. NCIMB 15449]|uniref:Winged helix DNA-binding domain-containing protein n=1 Tax=Antrihabitans spumae TaxID=3373370 RepID=A0ABW7JKN8_9NOCA
MKASGWKADDTVWSQVFTRRLDRQRLLNPTTDDPAAAARAMCGAHAQVLSAGELAVGLRMQSGTRSDVRRALTTGDPSCPPQLIKTFGPRGTVHLLATEDLSMWIAAMSGVPRLVAAVPESMRMSHEERLAVITAIADALATDDLTVDELDAAVVARTGSWAGDLVMPAFGGWWPRWRQSLGEAAQRGVLCFGANRGRKVTYSSTRRLVPDLVAMDEHTATRKLLQHYLFSYGPATPADFAHWLAAPRLWAAELFGSVRDELEPIDIDGVAMWTSAADTTFPEAGGGELHLLPYFDSYVIGSRPRERVFPGAAAARALSRGQAGNFPTLLIDGRVRGVWHHKRSGNTLAVTVEPLDTLTKRQVTRLEQQVERVGAVLEARTTLTIGTVSVGGHA